MFAKGHVLDRAGTVQNGKNTSSMDKSSVISLKICSRMKTSSKALCALFAAIPYISRKNWRVCRGRSGWYRRAHFKVSKNFQVGICSECLANSLRRKWTSKLSLLWAIRTTSPEQKSANSAPTSAKEGAEATISLVIWWMAVASEGMEQPGLTSFSKRRFCSGDHRLRFQ